MTFLSHLTQETIDAGLANVLLNGTLEDLAFYIQFVKNPNVPDKKYGRLPIWLAIEGNDAYEKTKLILSLNPDINVRNINGQTPLMMSLQKKAQGVSVLLLRHKNLDINATDNYKNGLMKYAVQSGFSKVVAEAIKQGVSLTCLDKYGHMPAYYAVQNEDMDIFKILYESGLKDHKDLPAYHEIIRLITTKDKQAMSMWQDAICHGIFPQNCYHQIHDWDTFYRRTKRLSSRTKLHLSKILSLLIDDDLAHYQSSKHSVHDILSEALIDRCRYGNAQEVMLLLSIGADPNARDKMGRTALFCATNYHPPKYENKTASEANDMAYRKVCILLEAGADPNLANIIKINDDYVLDETPLECALFLNRLGIFRQLHQAGALTNPPHRSNALAKIAAIYAKPNAIQMLDSLGIDFSTPDSDGVTPIEYAITHNQPYNVAAIRSLLIKNGKTTILTHEEQKKCPLYSLAIQHGELMEEALNGQLVSSDEQTPLTTIADDIPLTEKLKTLSPQKLAQLCFLSGVDLKVTQRSSSLNMPNPPIVIEKNTPIRNALANLKKQFRKHPHRH